MPFIEKSEINQFLPDANFDPMLDLVEVDLRGQKLYVSNINLVWGVRTEDETMSDSMISALQAQEKSLPGSPGIRIDLAEVGVKALFGAANYDWRGIWRSEQIVTGFNIVRRTDLLRSTVVIEQNT